MHTRFAVHLRRTGIRLAFLSAGALALSGLATVHAGSAFAAPANDNFADARALSGSSGAVTGSNVGATMEPGEPEHANYWGDETGSSVWYRWVAPASGRVEIATAAPHVVDIYTGSSISHLQNDERECDPDWYDDQCLKANVVAGTVYRISVAGGEGSFQLDWRLFTRPANDDFASPAVLSGLDAVFPSIEDGVDLATAEAEEPQHHAGSAASHSLWYRWTAKWDSDVTLGATVGDEGRMQCFYDATDLAVYTGSALTSLARVARVHVTQEEGASCETPGLSFTARAGTTYHIVVNAQNGYSPLSGRLSAVPRCNVIGTAANDTVVGTARDDVVCGLAGDDVLKGQGGDDVFIGGPGIDAASYADAPAAVTANLTTGTATGHGTDTLRDIENLVGSPFNDKLDGNAGANTLNGGAGIDGLWGQAGIDTILGADGADTVGGGPGADRINGGAGVDTAHFGQAPAITVNLTTGSATGEGTDVLTLFENVTGSPGADTITGNSAGNLLQGAGGNDKVLGQDGNDKLYGAGGNDALTGGMGTDTCDGGTDIDTASTCETRISTP